MCYCVIFLDKYCAIVMVGRMAPSIKLSRPLNAETSLCAITLEQVNLVPDLFVIYSQLHWAWIIYSTNRSRAKLGTSPLECSDGVTLSLWSWTHVSEGLFTSIEKYPKCLGRVIEGIARSFRTSVHILNQMTKMPYWNIHFLYIYAV